MGFVKGQSGNKNGRPKGKTNRITTEVKHAAIDLLMKFSPKLEEWINETAKKDPEKAYYMVMYPQEFAFPKLSRKEHVGEDGGQIKFDVTVSFIK